MTLTPRRSLQVLALALLTASLLTSPLTGSAVAEEGPEATGPFKNAKLNSLAGYLGTWEIDAKWADGTPLWSRNEFTVGLGGNFLVARTFARDGDGPVYERYLTYFGIDKETGNLFSHGFTYDGTTAVISPVVRGGEEGRESLTSQWSSGPATIKQTVQLTSPKTYSWKVWVQTGEDQWQQIMDGVWTRVDS